LIFRPSFCGASCDVFNFAMLTSVFLSTNDQLSGLRCGWLLYERTDSVQTPYSCTFGVKIAESDSLS
jgi:hypothetical protein